jgi:hypothetical protein
MKQRNFFIFFNQLINYYQNVKFYFFESFRLIISGKLFNNPRKTKYHITSGLLSLTPLKRDINFLSKSCHTKFGTLGIKL